MAEPRPSAGGSDDEFILQFPSSDSSDSEDTRRRRSPPAAISLSSSIRELPGSASFLPFKTAFDFNTLSEAASSSNVPFHSTSSPTNFAPFDFQSGFSRKVLRRKSISESAVDETDPLQRCSMPLEFEDDKLTAKDETSGETGPEPEPEPEPDPAQYENADQNVIVDGDLVFPKHFKVPLPPTPDDEAIIERIVGDYDLTSLFSRLPV
jgi:hypothetical protein